MVRFIKRRQPKRLASVRGVDNSVCQELLREVWQIEWDLGQARAAVHASSYLKHWGKCVGEARDARCELSLNDRAVAIKLVKLLQSNIDEDPTAFKNLVKAAYPKSANGSHGITDEQAEKALNFVLLLWLHVRPDISNSPSVPLKKIIQRCVPEENNSVYIKGELSDDFCIKHLRRKGGIDILWTDDLGKHLTMHEGQSVHVFKHPTMLLALQNSPNIDPFPAGFVSETLDTLYLLFRPLDSDKNRWSKRDMRRHRHVDLEMGMAEAKDAERSLDQFPFWHERLRDIQKVYDKKTPKGIRQWWFDRRDRVQWATFWVAFLVFVLTVVFGVTQSVTGILQVYAAYRIAN